MALKLLRSQTLVSPNWLARLLGCGDTIHILDCSWHLPNTGRKGHEEYTKQHIPGAQFFDIEICADKTTNLPHMMPNTETFEKYVGSLGISNNSLILLYDNNPQFGVFSSPRVWWTFRYFGHDNVVILEGGLPKYIAEGFDVTSEVKQVDEEDFFAKPNSNYLKKYEDIVENIKNNKFQLIDARPSGRFNGTAPEPRSDIKSGCIPNTVNIPFINVLNTEDRTMKPTDELLNIFKSAGVDLDKPVVASCGTGVSASVLALAAFVCGKRNMGIYDGSWTEWYQRAPDSLKINVPAE